MNLIEPYITKILKRNICHVISFGENDVTFIQHKHNYYPAKQYNTDMDNIKIEDINSARTQDISSNVKEDYERYLGDFPFHAGTKNILFTHDTTLNAAMTELKRNFDLIIVKDGSGIDIKYGEWEHGPTKISDDITYYVFDGKFYVFLKDGTVDELVNIFNSTLKPPFICIGAIDWLGDPLVYEGRLAAVKKGVKQGAAWAKNKIYPPKQNASDDGRTGDLIDLNGPTEDLIDLNGPTEDLIDGNGPYTDDLVTAIPRGTSSAHILQNLNSDLENAHENYYSSSRYSPFLINY